MASAALKFRAKRRGRGILAEKIAMPVKGMPAITHGEESRVRLAWGEDSMV